MAQFSYIWEKDEMWRMFIHSSHAFAGCMSNKRIVLLEAAPEPRPRPADPGPVREYSNRVAALAPSR